MRKIIIVILICTGSLVALYAQEQVAITKGNLSTLYRKAQNAERAGDNDIAVEYYKSILYIDMEQPVPYLKMANIYAANTNTPETVALAVAMYEKYLSLDPNSKDRKIITNKISELKQLEAEKKISEGWQETQVNLTAIIQSNPEKTKAAIMSAVHPAENARSKEEIVEQVDNITNLWNSAQNALNHNNDEEAIASLNQLLEQAPPSHPLYMQTNMVLAQIYRDRGDMQTVQEIVFDIESNVETNKELVQDHNFMFKDAIPFEDDICGIWVSDFSNDVFALPYVILEIGKYTESDFFARILPYCSLAKNHKMYKGRPFKYKPQLSRAKGSNYFAHSSWDTVSTVDNIIAFSFGDERFKGVDPTIVEVAINPAIDMATTVVTQVTSSTGIPIVDGVAAIFKIGAAISTNAKKTTTVFNLNIQRLFNGCAKLDLIKTTIVEKSTGKPYAESVDTTVMWLYKLYPDDSILFAAEKKELFGYREFNKEEIIAMEEYNHPDLNPKNNRYANASNQSDLGVMNLVTKGIKTTIFGVRASAMYKTHEDGQMRPLTGIGRFNERSYKQLEQKIVDFCWSKSMENPDFKIMTYELKTRFKYATKGLSYKTVTNKNGSFEGWMNMLGHMNGLGVCYLNNGYKYVGSWANNKYSGQGKFSTYCPDSIESEDCPPYKEYNGMFKEGKFHGKGTYIDDNIIYEGDFAYGKFHGKGEIEHFFNIVIDSQTYESSKIYKGDFVNNKYEGSGKLVDLNGDEFEGIWKKGHLKQGTVRYNNGDTYTGTFKYVKAEDPLLEKEVILPHGNGVMEFANGEKNVGKWNKGKYNKNLK
ncbi:MAG: hypothetical protein LBG80_20310 [Bacteroidales bacterium]|jgi:outer membrane protein assembly factor BamD (BamD/ComL family)|nr:hypothetical protein [Bacteroidales bacterium]